MCVRLSHSLNRSHWSQSKTCLFVRLKWRCHANQHKNGKKIIIENFIVGHEQMSNTLQKNIYNKYGNGCVCQFKSKSYERKST